MILIKKAQGWSGTVEYSAQGDVLTATIDDKSEDFDFTGMPDGEALEIMSDVWPDACPVLAARRENGVLIVTVLHWIVPEKAAVEEWQDQTVII